MTELSLRRACNLIYFSLIQNRSESDRAMFDSKLFQPPEGLTDESAFDGTPWSREDEMGAFRDVMAAAST